MLPLYPPTLMPDRNEVGEETPVWSRRIGECGVWVRKVLAAMRGWCLHAWAVIRSWLVMNMEWGSRRSSR
jgi:hypothetical protein